MQSHWYKLPTIRVIDAGYLLAGMEPERKWQFAPPLVKNFYDLIRNKTGARPMVITAGERATITQAEFQALKVEYGTTPAVEPEAVPDVDDLARRDFLAWKNSDTHHSPEYLAAQVLYYRCETDKLDKKIKEWDEAKPATVREMTDKQRTIAELTAKRDLMNGEALLWESQQPAPATDTATPAPNEELDYSLLATPAELLDAFGKWGMKAAWFDDLHSRNWLFDARKKKGQGTQGQVIQPLFCPYAVMKGLIGKVRKANRLQPDTAWRTLQHKFPKVYATFESHDPRDLTGD